MALRFTAHAEQSALRAAQASLAALATAVGDRGLTEAARRPDLHAAVDQHAAGVRDSLFGDARPLSAVALSGYASGIQEAAAGYGWRLPPDLSVWSAEDWVLTRLVAVCALARALDRPALSGPPGP